MRDARQDLLPLDTVPGPGNRQNDLFGKSILERGEYLLDHVRFDRSDHDIGCGDNLGGIVAGGHAARLAALNQCVVATRAGAHVARSYTGSDPAIALAILPKPTNPIFISHSPLRHALQKRKLLFHAIVSYCRPICDTARHD